jgi:hypothetical protein
MQELYSFTSDAEPTIEQLDELMRAVSEDVKARAINAEAAFKAWQAEILAKNIELWQRKQHE